MSIAEKNFEKSLKAADRQIEDHSLSATSARRIRQRLEKRVTPKQRLRRFVPIAGMVAVALAVLLVMTFSPGDEVVDNSRVHGFRIENASADLRLRTSSDFGVSVEAGYAEFVRMEPGVRLQVSAPATFAGGQDIRIIDGSVRVQVAKQELGETAVRIRVSHGFIEVLGTEFTITQSEDKGMVILHQGAIRFVPDTGGARLLAVGETLGWPVPELADAAILPTPKSARKTAVESAGEVPSERDEATKGQATKGHLSNSRKAPRKPKSAAAKNTPLPPPADTVKRDVISLVAKLRSRRKYQEAAELLREAIEDKSITKTIREQLSYELGVILSNQLIDKASACKHWGRHRKRYADGRYQSEVSSAETRLGCTF